MDNNENTNNSLMLLARSLTYLLNINEGIVIEVTEDLINPFKDITDSNKVIIYNDGTNIVINEYVGNAEDGEFVDIIDENILLN